MAEFTAASLAADLREIDEAISRLREKGRLTLEDEVELIAIGAMMAAAEWKAQSYCDAAERIIRERNHVG